jgi:hypothetical protein
MNTQTNTMGYTVVILDKNGVLVMDRGLTEIEANEKRMYYYNGGEEARVISDKTAEIMCY